MLQKQVKHKQKISSISEGHLIQGISPQQRAGHFEIEMPTLSMHLVFPIIRQKHLFVSASHQLTARSFGITLHLEYDVKLAFRP